METLTLNRKETALVVAARSQQTGDNGDLFNAIWDDSPTEYYNALRLEYIEKEAEIKDCLDADGQVIGTDEYGCPIQIGGMPSRPRPKGL